VFPGDVDFLHRSVTEEVHTRCLHAGDDDREKNGVVDFDVEQFEVDLLVVEQPACVFYVVFVVFNDRRQSRFDLINECLDLFGVFGVVGELSLYVYSSCLIDVGGACLEYLLFLAFVFFVLGAE
jgi:hypothetical protein